MSLRLLARDKCDTEQFSNSQAINEQEEIDHDKLIKDRDRIKSFQSSDSKQSDIHPARLNQVERVKVRESIQSNMTYGSDQTENDEDFDVWDNQKDVRVVAALTDETPNIAEVQNFLKFYKMRFGGFPGLPESISNEQVIETAVKFAGQNKRLFRKYFPTKQVEFDDQHDYSQPYDQDQDTNFHEFKKFC